MACMLRSLPASVLRACYLAAAFVLARRVRVSGWSMHPALAPDEIVLFDRLWYRLSAPRPGEVVLARDPRDPERWLIKRIGQVREDGMLCLLGDQPDHSTDSRHFGSVPRSALLGRGWLVVWPPQRRRRIAV